MPDAPRPDQNLLLTFRVGAATLAAAAGEVTEVFRRSKVTRVPNAPSSLAGVAHLRGAVVPVVSLACLLGAEEAPETAAARILLLALDPPVGVKVDAVGMLTKRDRADDDDGGETRPGRLFIEDDQAVRTVDLRALLERDFASLGRRAGRDRPAPAKVAAVPRAARLAFLAFDIAGQVYALPLDEVTEIIPLPSVVAAFPQSDTAILGVVPWRGALLPIISLRSLLGFETIAADPRRARIVVARIGPSTIGLVVDRMREILRAAPDAVGPLPSVLNRGAGEALIQSICRLDDGRGLVSILSSERLFREETVARILADGNERGSDMQIAAESDGRETVLVFRLGDEEYGLPIAAVDEIVRLPDTLTRVPRAPGFVHGVMNFRGKALPVIDQRQRFGVAGTSRGRRRVIVTTLGNRQAGFVVDSVSELLAVPADQVTATPDLAAEGDLLFDRVVTLAVDGRMILLVDPQQLLNRAERDLLAALETPDAGVVAS